MVDHMLEEPIGLNSSVNNILLKYTLTFQALPSQNLYKFYSIDFKPANQVQSWVNHIIIDLILGRNLPELKLFG